jgi:hypothetical protein
VTGGIGGMIDQIVFSEALLVELVQEADAAPAHAGAASEN